MHQDVRRHRELIDASGMGLLPGIALALGVAVIATGALVFESWWFTIGVLAVVLCAAAAVAGVVYLLSDDED